jgi:hypothetical protein
MLALLSTSLTIECDLIPMQHNAFSWLPLFKYVPPFNAIVTSVIVIYYAAATVIFILTRVLGDMLILTPTENLIDSRVIMLASTISLDDSLVLKSNRVFDTLGWLQ